MSNTKKPTWWLLYLLWFGMAGLLAWDYWTPRAPWLQKSLALVIMFVFCGLIVWWLRSNRAALEREDDEQEARELSRDRPQTPVQRGYLRAMKRYKT